MYIQKAATVGPDKPAIPGRRCFELISSHQQGILITCLAHHPVYSHKVNQNACGSEASELMSLLDQFESGK